MSFLVHTDFGHDPDDCIALTFLIELDYWPDTISLTPSFWEQECVLTGFIQKLLPFPLSNINLEKAGLDNSKKKEYNPGKHKMFLSNMKYAFFPFEEKHYDKVLILGPAKNIGDKISCDELFFQGGYSPNSIEPLEKFKNVKAIASFNPCGARVDFNTILESDKIKKKYYIGKNVCHGFTKRDLEKFWKPKNETILKFWNQLHECKAMHDVLASMLMFDKKIGIWSQEKPKWETKSKLTTEPTNEEIYTLIGLNYEYLKRCLSN